MSTKFLKMLRTRVRWTIEYINNPAGNPEFIATHRPAKACAAALASALATGFALASLN